MNRRRLPARELPLPAGRLEIIPPARRLVVPGHSPYCPSCERFTRAGGGCPGVVPRNPQALPVCYVSRRVPESRYVAIRDAGGESVEEVTA